MWLLNATSERLEYVPDQNGTDYAILSHTWAEEEVTFQDMQIREPHRDLVKQKHGYQKIGYACEQALADGLQYVWIDTCCIDKSSSAELSEAINSMFNWYRDAQVCYAYLSDVHKGDSPTEKFRSSRWFTRGWTLQELLAPQQLVFYTSDWTTLGTKVDLSAVIELITGIKKVYLQWPEWIFRASVARRMSWAAHRNTTRIEDRAYSLLGIFDVHIALLYGEGKKAFWRLQEEIIRRSTDQSVLAWSIGPNAILADSPDSFAECGRIECYAGYDIFLSERMDFSSVGIQLTAPVMLGDPDAASHLSHNYNLVLNCMYEDDARGLIGLKVRSEPGSQSMFSTLDADVMMLSSRELDVVPLENIQTTEIRRIVLTSEASRDDRSLSKVLGTEFRRSFWFRAHGRFGLKYEISDASPGGIWKHAASMLVWPPMDVSTFSCRGRVTWKSRNKDSYIHLIMKVLPLETEKIGHAGSNVALYRVIHSPDPIVLDDSETYIDGKDSDAWKRFELKPFQEKHDWTRSTTLLMTKEICVGAGPAERIAVNGEYQLRLGQIVYVVDIGFRKAEDVEPTQRQPSLDPSLDTEMGQYEFQ